jgi:hypothetical protein
MKNLKTFEEFVNESNEMGGYYLMSTLLDLADDSKRIRDTKMHDAYMYLHDRIDQSYRDIDLSRDDIRDLLKEPQGRKHAKNLPDWAIEDLFTESLNEANKINSFPDSFTIVKEAYLIGYRDSFAGRTTKNYTSYQWEDKNDRFNNVDTLLKGTYKLDKGSVDGNYAEYSKGSGEPRGLNMEELNRLLELKLIKI